MEDYDFFVANAESWSKATKDSTLQLTDRVNAAQMIAYSLSKGFELNNNILQNLETALINGNNEINKELIRIFYLQAQKGKPLSGNIVSYFENRLNHNDIDIDVEIVSVILGAQTIKHDIKLRPETVNILSTFINDNKLNSSARNNFALTLQNQLNLGVVSEENVLQEIEKCYLQEELPALRDICASILNDIAKEGKITSSNIPILEQALENKETIGSATIILISAIYKHPEIASASIIDKLSNIVKDNNIDFDIRYKAALTILIIVENNLLENSMDKILQNLVLSMGSGDKDLEDVLHKIFLGSSIKEIKLNHKIISYYEGLFEECTDFTKIQGFSVLLGKQILKYGIQLSKTSIDKIIILLNNSALHDETRINFLVMLNKQIKFILTHEQVLEDSIIEILSKVASNKSYSVEARVNAADIMLYVVQELKKVDENIIKNLEKSLHIKASDNSQQILQTQEKQINKLILIIISIAVKNGYYTPNNNSLKYFEELFIQDTNLEELALYSISSILKSGATLSVNTELKFIEIIKSKTADLKIKKAVISGIGHNIEHSNKTLDNDTLEIFAELINNGALNEAIFLTLNSHIKNKGYVNNNLLENLLNISEYSHLIELFYEFAKNYKLQSSKILDFLGYSLTVGYISKEDREKSYYILKDHSHLLGNTLKILLDQENISHKLVKGGKENVNILEKVKIYAKAGYKLTWNVLINLERLLGNHVVQVEINNIYEIISLLLDHNQNVPHNIIEKIMNSYKENNPYLVPLLLKIAEKNSYYADKILQILINIIDTKKADQSALKDIINTVKILSAQGYDINNSLIKNLQNLLFSEGKVRPVKEIILFLDFLAQSNIFLSGNVFSDIKGLLSSSDIALQNSVLNLYKNLSRNVNIPKTDIELLFKMLGQSTIAIQADILDILTNANSNVPFSQQKLDLLKLYKNIWNFKNTEQIAAKVEYSQNLFELLNKDNATNANLA